MRAPKKFIYTSPHCPDCQSPRIRRTTRRGWREVPLSWARILPFHCGDCYHRFLRLTVRD